MTEPTRDGTVGAYTIKCASCEVPFDACAAAMCQCLTQVNTPVCPQCGHCLCRLPKETQRQFWSGAPEVLWKKRLAASHRRKDAKPAATQPPTQSSGLKRPLVLVADDEPTTRLMATGLLENLGCGVVVAPDGQEALRLARELRPDLVLSDALMPKLGGRELAKALKEDPETASLKVVLMTSIYTKESHKTEAIKTYLCDGFLRKPVGAEDLRKLLNIPAPPPPLARTE